MGAACLASLARDKSRALDALRGYDTNTFQKCVPLFWRSPLRARVERLLLKSHGGEAGCRLLSCWGTGHTDRSALDIAEPCSP